MRIRNSSAIHLIQAGACIFLFLSFLPELLAMSMVTQRPHLLFVYGTLKRGYYNHNVYLRLAEVNGAAKYLGNATTREKFALKILGERCVPALMEEPPDFFVHGEVYCISDDVLEAMDLLEGVAEGHYFRRQRTVQMQTNKMESLNSNEETCWVYMQTPKLKNTLNQNGPSYNSYTKDLHKTYVPPTTGPDPSILKLLQ